MSKMTRIQRRAKSHPPVLRPLFWVILLALLLTISVIGGRAVWRWVQTPSAFPIRHIVVQGEFQHLNTAHLTSAVQARLSGGFFSLHLSEAKQAIAQTPWVASVAFRREWPDTLLVSVEERKPLAKFNEKGVLSAEGIIFYPETGTVPAELPQFQGSESDSTQIATLYQTVNTLSQLVGLTVVRLQQDAKNSWQLEFNNHISVILGEEEPLARFQRFIAVYPNLLKQSKKSIVLVDLRYPDGLAVQYANALV